MRYGLFALSLAMLTGGGFAAQSAFAISQSASALQPPAAARRLAMAQDGGAHGPLPFTAARDARSIVTAP